MKRLFNYLSSNWISVIALLISSFAAFFSYDQNIIAKRLSLQHIVPSIKSQFDFPEKGVPVYAISNNGDIPVVSLRINHNMHVFDKTINKIKFSALNSNLFGDYWVYIKEFEPTKYEYYKLLRLNPANRNKGNYIYVYQFDLKYYRATDMQEYTKEQIYFVDNGIAFNHMQFIQNENYKKVMYAIDNFKAPETKSEPGNLKEFLEKMDKS